MSNSLKHPIIKIILSHNAISHYMELIYKTWQTHICMILCSDTIMYYRIIRIQTIMKPINKKNLISEFVISVSEEI